MYIKRDLERIIRKYISTREIENPISLISQRGLARLRD
jgi:hypothetical protein